MLPDTAWVEQTLATMTLREKLGQLLVPILPGHLPVAEVAGMVKEFALGGGHYFGGTLEHSVAFTGAMQAAARIPLLITGDLDRGGGDRIREGTLFQCQMALGAADDEALAYALGKAIAVENRAAGYNWTFSPIVDLCGIRDHLRHIASIGEDPAQVGRLIAAQIRGIQEHGMVACAKHFPGDGFDDRNQHLTTSINPLSAKEWFKLTAPPFQAAIAAEVYSVMNSCIAMPALDPGAGDPQFPRPSALSRPLTEGLLRKRLGFDGVIITDALNMGGASMHLPIPERYAQAFVAGNDMLLFVRNLAQTVAYLQECVRSGRIRERRLDASVRRILTMKTRIGLHRMAPATLAERRRVFVDSPFRADARKLAERSITLLRDRRRRVPMSGLAGSRVASVLLTNRENEFKAEVFNRVLREAGCTVTELINPDTETMYDRVAAHEFDVVITSLYFPILWPSSTARTHGQSACSLMSGYHLAHPKVQPVFISFDSPFRLYELAGMDPFLVTYGSAPAAQEAVARALLGAIPITGRVPVSLPGFFKAGDGLQRRVRAPARSKTRSKA